MKGIHPAHFAEIGVRFNIYSIYYFEDRVTLDFYCAIDALYLNFSLNYLIVLNYQSLYLIGWFS